MTVTPGKMTQYRAIDSDLEIEVISIEDEVVSFCRAGGGFIRKMSTTDLELLFKELPPRVMVECTTCADFYCDADDNFLPLKCYSDGRLWNGFGIPFVEPAELEKFIKTANASNGSDDFELSIKDDRFYYISEEDADGTPNYVPLSTIVVDGKTISGYDLDIGWTFDRCVPIARQRCELSADTNEVMKP